MKLACKLKTLTIIPNKTLISGVSRVTAVYVHTKFHAVHL